MSNELISADDLADLPLTSFKELTSSENDFFYRMQLYGAKSNASQEGLVPPNHYGIPEDNEVIDLGDELDVFILAWRPKALSVNEEPIVESFDPESPEFQDIKNRSNIKDSGCMYGPEFLFWVPSVERFLTFFMSSKTARREARKMEPLLRCVATLKSKIIKQGKNVWTGPVVIACSTPMDLPDINILKAKVLQFKNPPKQEVELAGEDDRER